MCVSVCVHVCVYYTILAILPALTRMPIVTVLVHMIVLRVVVCGPVAMLFG